jgi:N-methylhydantoinase B/oxoprolinase/acetone carboxylase alpha subunit
MAEELRLSCFIEKEQIAPWGLFGGGPGRRSAMLVSRAGGPFQTFGEAFGVACDGKFSDCYLRRGDVVRIVTAGGGGYGDPLERTFEEIEEDVRQGLLSRATVEQDYAVVFDDAAAIDPEATARRRAGR